MLWEEREIQQRMPRGVGRPSLTLHRSPVKVSKSLSRRFPAGGGAGGGAGDGAPPPRLCFFLLIKSIMKEETDIMRNKEVNEENIEGERS